jgi:NADH dehydrogenase (ubiquinone) 1 beta subcomplex subunit 7
MIATNEEMDAAKVPLAYRDYCAHLFIKWQSCMRDKFLHWKCEEEKIAMEKCHHDE